MKKKLFLCTVLLLAVLLCSCGKTAAQDPMIPESPTQADVKIDPANISLDGLDLTLNQSCYRDFISNGWHCDAAEPTIHEVTIEDNIHYEFTVTLTKGDLTTAEATFFSEDPQLDPDNWTLVSAVITLNDNTAPMALPIDLLAYETAEELNAFFLDQFNTSIKKTSQSSTDYEYGIVLEGYYYGIVFSEDNERLALCVEVDDIVNTSQSRRIYSAPAAPTEPKEDNFAKVDERHSFTYDADVYVVGKHKLKDFLDDGWMIFGDYQEDFVTEPMHAYTVAYLQRDNAVIGPLCFVNGSETDSRLLKDCTLIKCTIPLNYDMGVEYDNSGLVLPYSLQADMNSDQIADLFEAQGDYECFYETRDDGVYYALGIVSPYNAGALMTLDKSTLQYIFMEVNEFYAADFAK